MAVETYFIGVDGEKAISAKYTQQQIDMVKSLDCALEHEGGSLSWDSLDNPEEPKTLFQTILRDREMRIDRKVYMEDRPAFCVITARDGKAIRLEYYEGRDALSLRYDFRSRELQGKKLPRFLNEDPQAYDPVKFLKEAFDIPEGFTKPGLEVFPEQTDPPDDGEDGFTH